jgi:hypothetical protein
MSEHHSTCAKCRQHDYVRPLHGDKGGPFCCVVCIGKHNAEHGKRRRLLPIFKRALAAYEAAGGNMYDVYMPDPADPADLADEAIQLTPELLADAIRLAHPDCHPPERRELAQRVTQELLALKPFTFSAAKPKPPKQTASSGVTAIKRVEIRPAEKPLQYPCNECRKTAPHWYCSECRAEYDRRHRVYLDGENVKVRARRKKRREARVGICSACGVRFKGKRQDARFCSDTCRQQVHRKSVTDTQKGCANRAV